MNTLDIIVLVILAFSCINGLRQGLFSALANLLGWILALFIASRCSATLAPLMSGVSHSVMVQKVAAFACVALVVIVLTWLVTGVLNSMVKTLKLDPLNRLAGGAWYTEKFIYRSHYYAEFGTLVTSCRLMEAFLICSGTFALCTACNRSIERSCQ